ncbi:sugar phosphate isomerase/epimerase family protein [Marinilactibacillus psychrotolerans]|uniref:Xylose isomerase n=1 Tax=Marinilactibacillus psychrotolerans TaxID=191770 RepID=A0AAV3WUL3_9LACT|nr:sugar phosphate isomerase/epimerase [Marinilactibacillus psychrotolerans]GEL67156.1 xylose isomerase [Marinilactibacillus psychrotolerans]GEQ35431.1 xylose isomerase [Marinilactibacillus psychrotolerans]SDC89308.1 Sugar phosphate isomerase/epimerase [Marinilactibacillus psychrotolerans]
MKFNIGIRAHDIENETLEDLANTIENKGIQSIQLALMKSVKEFPLNQESFNIGFASKIGRLFDEKGIDISVLGCYINMIHPDEIARRKALDFFKTHIRYASQFKAATVGTETGGVYPEIQFTKDNYTEEAYLKVVESISELVNEAEKFGVIMTVEGGINHPIYSPSMMKRLLDDIDSQNLQVILDPVNYLYPEDTTIEKQHAIIDEAFDLFGDRITVIHAKDYVIENRELKIVPVGKGELDYTYFIEKIKQSKPMIPILLEETQEPYIDESLHFLKNKFIK